MKGTFAKMVAATAVIGLVAACATDPIAPTTRVVDAAAAVSIPSTGLNENVWVCKDAPSGSFDFTVTGTITQPAPGNTMNIINAAPTIAAGNCTQVASAGNGNSVTVTELAEPGYVLDRVEAFYIALNSSTLVADGTSFSASITRSYGDLGRVFVFYNVATPSTGCTLTLGYWKTHNATFPGGAPVDPTWASYLASAENTTFFLSGQTWYQVFWTPVGGNAYYNLAHQYMAASLNVAAGATPPAAVATALASATTLFNTHTPAHIGALSGNDALRKQFISLAGTLGAFNEGTTGPGHCSDTPVD